jgi:hypothetical protein
MTVQTFGKRAEDRVSRFITILSAISFEGIMEGEVASNIALYQLCFTRIQGLTEFVTLEVASNMKHYVDEIDRRDEYIY